MLTHPTLTRIYADQQADGAARYDAALAAYAEARAALAADPSWRTLDRVAAAERVLRVFWPVDAPLTDEAVAAVRAERAPVDCRRCGEAHAADGDAAYDCALNFYRTDHPEAE
jgi:hypothetical protein